MEQTEILRAAQSALLFNFVVGADGGAFAQPAGRSLPFVLTNSFASTRNAGVHPTAMTAELVLVRRPRSDRGRRRRDGVRARDGRHFQTNLVLRHGGGTNFQTMFCGAFCGACGLLPMYALPGRRNQARQPGEKHLGHKPSSSIKSATCHSCL